MTITSTNYMPVVRINAPEWYLRDDWLEWLNYSGPGLRPATWHAPGSEAHEHSDVFFTYEEGDGSDSPQFMEGAVPEKNHNRCIPMDIWEQITAALRERGMGNTACLLWISNLQG